MKYQAKLVASSPSESEQQQFVVVGPFPTNSDIKNVRLLGPKSEIAKLFAQVRGLEAPIEGDVTATLNKLKDATLEVEHAEGKVSIRLLPDGEPVDFSKFEDSGADQRDQAQILGTLDPSKVMPGEDENQDALTTAADAEPGADTPPTGSKSSPNTIEDKQIA